ncbi:hypothetical protein K1719_035618 [Acacia pycnantha]|nr:hypothetical protein K1719_035618 [Acacia pycnantha]
MNKLRQEYSSFKKLLSISSFGNPQWEKFQKNGLPWEQLVEIFGDVYASGDNGVGNAKVHQISDGDGDNIDKPIETTSPPSLVLHRQDRTPNAKCRRRSGNKDIAMACQAIQDLVKIRQNQYHYIFANSATAKVNEDPYSIEAAMDVLNDMVGLENEAYRKAIDQMVESQAWRVAFIKAPPERRASLI